MSLSPSCLLLGRLSQLLLTLSFEILLLCLGIESLELSIALGLLGLLTLRQTLLSLLIFLGLLDLLDGRITRCLDFAQDLGTETSRRDKHVGDPDELLENRNKVVVVVVRGEAVLEVNALAGSSLVDSMVL